MESPIAGFGLIMNYFKYCRNYLNFELGGCRQKYCASIVRFTIGAASSGWQRSAAGGP